MNIFTNTNFQIIQKRKAAYLISAIVILAGIISMVINGGPKYGIDFTGGISLELDFSPVQQGTEPVKIDAIRETMKSMGQSSAEIQRLGKSDSNIFLIKAQTTEKGSQIEEIIGAFKKELPQYTNKPEKEFVRLQQEIGPRVGEELKWQAIKAIFVSLILMIIYIWIRFELTFGVAAIIALFHDVLITLSIFSILGKEISTSIIAALLMIVGYSINDTIVVFDRIREDLRKHHRDSFATVFNTSINKTLSRTIITSGTTIITALSLYIFGGTVIRDFSFAILIGVITGTYSSIFIASPIVVDWFHATKKDHPRFKKLTGHK
ncbi:MAG: protein translocase subunit SecF [Candidatus Cloacimonetes bacterium]|nr:protein translocase subunit SecF [Candidatus Cloacimonadota bacterium]